LAMNAKEDVGFAASLIVLLLIGTIIAMPIILPMVAEGARVSPWAIARPLLITMFLPLIVGFILRPLLPELSQRAVPVLATILTISLWVMVGLSLFLNRNAVIDIFGEGAILLSALFLALAYVLGYITGGFDKPERVVLGFGAAQRNFAAAIVVATQAFDEPRVLVMAVVVSIVAMLIIPFSSFLGRRKARTGGEHAPPFPSR
jgi:BASS family bile acid:Na+ symporter